MLYTAEGWLGSRTASVLRAHQPERLVIAGTPATFTHDVVAAALLAAGSSTPPASCCWLAVVGRLLLAGPC